MNLNKISHTQSLMWKSLSLLQGTEPLGSVSVAWDGYSKLVFLFLLVIIALVCTATNHLKDIGTPKDDSRTVLHLK